MGFMDQVRMRAKNAQNELVSLIKPEAPYEQWLKNNPIGKGIKEGMEIKMVDKEVARHRKMIDGIHETYKKKNRDYGDAFGVSLDKRGLVAALVRMEDKLGRLDSLKDRDPLVKDESLQDTLLDLANYAIMTAMWLERKSEEPTVIYADGEPYLTINPEVVGSVVDDYLEKREKEGDHITITPTEVKNGHEARMNKLVAEHEKMEFRESTPLVPGIKLEEGRKIYITNNGSYELDGCWLTTRDCEGNAIDTARVDIGNNLILTVIPEPKEGK